MRVPESLVICRGDAFGLGEAPTGFSLQDSIAPIVDHVRALCTEPVLLMRLLDPAGNVNVFQCEDGPGLEWRPFDALEEFVPAPIAEAIRAPTGPPWYRGTFHAELLADVTQGLSLSGRPEQIRVSPLSCIYRLPADDGAYWVKVRRPDAFAPEAEIMTVLADAFSELVPRPLAFRDEWMLTADFGVRLKEDTETQVVARFLRTFAQMQLASAPLLGTPGLQSWKLAELPGQVDASVEVEHVTRDVEALAQIGMDECLVHGDLYWGNVALDEGQIRIFDWADAGISHPFLDPIVLDAEAADAYLGPWRERLDVDVDGAWRIARRLSPAHHLARNLQLLSHLEPFERPTVAGGARYFADALRRAYAKV